MKEGLLKWKVHTPNLLNEILINKEAAILSIPLNIVGKLLYKVALRASGLNDPELNALMVRLTLYEIADPQSENYDQELCDKILMEVN